MSPVCHRLWGRELTRDTFLDGRVQVYQPRCGWRFSVDAPILADFVGGLTKARHGVEVGVGCGIVSLLLLHKKKLQSVTGFEIQPFYARLCDLNMRANRLNSRFAVQCEDFLSSKETPESIPLIFANPPFFDPGRGRVSPKEEIRLAKWEVTISVARLLHVAKGLLMESGKLVMILPSLRETEFRQEFAKKGFFVERYRAVRPFLNGKTERFLVQLSTVSVEEHQHPPLILFTGPGQYSAEMVSILRG